MSITVAPSSSFEASFEVGTTGLVGTLAVGIYEGSTDTAHTALATTVINEIGTTGLYVATRTSPSTAGQYLIVWSLDGTLTPAQLATEDLVVSAAAAATVSATAGDYITSAQLKDALGITVTTYDTRIARIITAASRAVDGICDRRFYADADATSVRQYTANRNVVIIDDVVTVTSVKTDTAGDYTYATTLTANTDYLTEPFNAADDGKPYTRLAANPRSGYWFSEHLRWVQVTAQFGWPSVPYPIVDATMIVAIKLFKRPETPFGIMTAGVDQATAMRIAMTDPDVRMLCEPFKRLGV